MPLDPAKIKARRKNLGLTPEQAAIRAGMARPNWLRLESGKRARPSLDAAERIAEALGCSVLLILTRD